MEFVKAALHKWDERVCVSGVFWETNVRGREENGDDESDGEDVAILKCMGSYLGVG